MKKQTMIILGVVVVLAIVLVLIFSLGGGDDSETSPETQSPEGSKVLSEQEKFAQFQAELSCELATSSSAEDVLGAMEKTAPLMKKYGYTDAQYQELTAKYENEDSFRELVLSEMKERCPEAMNQ